MQVQAMRAVKKPNMWERALCGSCDDEDGLSLFPKWTWCWAESALRLLISLGLDLSPFLLLPDEVLFPLDEPRGCDRGRPKDAGGTGSIF